MFQLGRATLLVSPRVVRYGVQAFITLRAGYVCITGVLVSNQGLHEHSNQDPIVYVSRIKAELALLPDTIPNSMLTVYKLQNRTPTHYYYQERLAEE